MSYKAREWSLIPAHLELGACDTDLKELAVTIEYSQLPFKSLLIMMPIMHEFIGIHFGSIFSVPRHLSIICSTCLQPSVVNTISFLWSPWCFPPILRSSPSLNSVVKHFVSGLESLLCDLCCDEIPSRSNLLEEDYILAWDSKAFQSIMAGKALHGGSTVVGAWGTDPHMADRPGSRKWHGGARNNIPPRPRPRDSFLQPGPHFLKVPQPIKGVYHPLDFVL